MEYYVEIYNIETEEVVKRMGPHSERKAQKIAEGASINLNHENYAVRVVEDDPSDIMVVAGNPFRGYTGTLTFTSLQILGSNLTHKQALELIREKFDDCGGLILAINQRTGKEETI